MLDTDALETKLITDFRLSVIGSAVTSLCLKYNFRNSNEIINEAAKPQHIIAL